MSERILKVFSLQRFLSQIVLRRPLVVIAAVLAVSLFFAVQIPNLTFSTSIYDLIIDDLPETDQYAAFKETFGSDEIIRVVIKAGDIFDPATYRHIEILSNQAAALAGVRRVISLPEVRKAVDAGGQWPLDRFAEVLLPVSLFRSNLISEDRTATVLTLLLENEANHEQVIGDVSALIAGAEEGLTLYQIGMPLVSQALATFTEKDFFRLPPITFALIAMVLLVLFRSIRYLFFPLACVTLTLVWTFGLMAMTRIPLSMLIMIVPVFLIAVGTAYCLHIVSACIAETKFSRSSREMVLEAFSNIGFPTILAVTTTIIGLGSLFLNRITAIREFALFSCFGMVSLLVIAMTAFPAGMSLLSPGRSAKARQATSAPWIEQLLSVIIRLNLRHQRKVLPVLAVVVIFCLLGIFQLRVETNPVGYFKPDTPVSRHFHDIYRHLSGSFPINVVVESPQEFFFESSEHIADIARMQAHLDTLPGVDKTVSFADYLKLVNYASNGYKAEYYRLPEEAWEARMLINSYRIMLGEEMMTRFMTPNFTAANIMLLTHMSSSRDFLRIRDQVLGHAKQHFSPDLNWKVTGFGVVVSASSHLLTSGQIKSLSLTMILVFAIMFTLFLSAKVGLIAILPNLFPIVINFGIMGWFGVELSMFTSLIASIAIGLAVDDTIHYMVRYNREFRKDLDDRRALKETLLNMGRPIVFTTITISIGFAVLSLSNFTPTAIFGTMMVITMISALVGDLILLPSLMLHVELVTLWDLIRLKLGKEARLGIPLFNGLSRTQINYILMAGSLQPFSAGEVLFRKGDASDSMYAVISGGLDVFDPIEDPEATDPGCVHKLVQRLRVGDVVGEMGLLRSAPRSATVIGKHPGELLRINMKMIKRLQWLYPPTAHRFFFNMMNILCDRLESATHCMAALSLEDDLTHLCNRRCFVKILEAETYRARRFEEPLSMLVMKVDFTAVKEGEDTEAHDRILEQICRSLFPDIRRCDTFGRLDINTFGLLMPRTAPEKAKSVCDRLRGVLAEHRFSSDGWKADVVLEPVDLSGQEHLPPAQILEKALSQLPAMSH
jgi:diguanylate cyclase (GGDEF)-like protein